MIEFTLTRTSTAPMEKVFDSLTDHCGIAGYHKMCSRSTLDREGIPAPNGIGAVRRIEALGLAVVEEVVAYERPTGYVYKMVSGAPVRDHVGTVSLRDNGTGTVITWHLTSTPKIPGVDWVLAAALKKLIGDMVDGAIAAAERNA